MAIEAGQTIEAADVLAMVAPEYTDGETHSLTTVAGERILILAKGNIDATGAGNNLVELKYNGVTVDDVNIDVGAGLDVPFFLMHYFTPGAATANITLVKSAGTAWANTRIMAIRLNKKS